MSTLPTSVTPDTIAGHMDSAPVNNNFGAFATALNNLLTILSGGSTGQVLESGGAGAVVWGVAQKVTVSNFASGPPAAPSDGDIWIATNPEGSINSANSYMRWQFQYHAGSAGSSKWEFIGGPPVFAEIVTQESTASASYAALATPGPIITLARAGDYLVEIGAEALNTTNGDGTFMSYDIGATGAVDADGFRTVQPAAANTVVFPGGRARLKTNLAAATTLTAKYKAVTGGTAWHANRWMRVLPVRIA